MITTITPQSVVMGNGTNHTIIEAAGFESPVVDIASYPLAGAHGIKVVRGLWRERRAHLVFALRESTVAAYGTLRRAFIGAWDLPRNGVTTIPFTTSDGKNLEMSAMLRNSIDGGFSPGEVTTGKMRVELVIPDPNFYGQTTNETNITTPVAGGIDLPTALPFDFVLNGGVATITNSGNGVSYPTIRVSGPATNPHIKNTTLNKTLIITATIAAGSYVDINMRNQTVLLNGATNYLYLTSGDYWWLQSGANTVNFSADDNDPAANLRVQWQDAYLGI